MNNSTTTQNQCQEAKAIYTADVQRKLTKLQIKKAYNKSVIDWLINKRANPEKAVAIYECATYIEFTPNENMAQIVKANFCRQRLCHVCAWRRQAKFLSQMTPVIEEITSQGYEFIFITLTVQNAPLHILNKTIDTMMRAYNKFLSRKKIHDSFCGCIRSTELTYNPTTNTFHPHFHLLVAVEPKYFYKRDYYISQKELTTIWQTCLGVSYTPVCHIEKVTGTKRAEVETLKYALKPSRYDEALEAFDSILRGRRLISFSGIFNKYRKEFEREQDGNLLDKVSSPIALSTCYRFDPTGGIYRFYNTFEREEIFNYDEIGVIRNRVKALTDKVYDDATGNGAVIAYPKKHV